MTLEEAACFLKFYIAVTPLVGAALWALEVELKLDLSGPEGIARVPRFGPDCWFFTVAGIRRVEWTPTALRIDPAVVI